MSSTPTSAHRVLAIGLDAVEASLVRRLIDAGELPEMARLLQSGWWSRVTSPAQISSGSVWPTFSTGLDACDHGLYSRWNWDPAGMELCYTDPQPWPPFWQGLAAEGRTVGVLDVPFAPFVRLGTGFEVLEYGAHDRVVGRLRVSPQRVADEVVAGHPGQPFGDDLAVAGDVPEDLPRLLQDCLDGIRLHGDLAVDLITDARPDVAVVVFSEGHRGGHRLWHTVQPDLALYADLPAIAWPDKTLTDLYRALDDQIGRLVEASGPGTTVYVFDLHGMEAGRGEPPVLEPLLAHLGLSHLAEAAPSLGSLLSSVKKRLPAPVRDLYRRSVPLERRSRWGRAQVLPRYDWSRTRAFALPIDQEAHVRVNAAGREARGIVRQDEVAGICDEIEAALAALRTVDGRPVLDRVVRPARGASTAGLPDLVAHWHRDAVTGPIEVGGALVHPSSRGVTGRHTHDGFLIAGGPGAPGGSPGSVDAAELHGMIRAAATG